MTAWGCIQPKNNEVCESNLSSSQLCYRVYWASLVAVLALVQPCFCFALSTCAAHSASCAYCFPGATFLTRLRNKTKLPAAPSVTRLFPSAIKAACCSSALDLISAWLHASVFNYHRLLQWKKRECSSRKTKRNKNLCRPKKKTVMSKKNEQFFWPPF